MKRVVLSRYEDGEPAESVSVLTYVVLVVGGLVLLVEAIAVIAAGRT